MSLVEYEKAKEGYLKVLEIKKKQYGEDNAEYSVTLQNFCNTLNNLGEY
jgi:hypothetical protein